jgi:hypothetical protein
MRFGIIAAATVTAVLTGLPATGARAQEWCGYAAKEHAIIQCGYTTVAECENVVGKGGMCFLDPEIARIDVHAKPVTPVKFTPRQN